jgi:hypothetical protein
MNRDRKDKTINLRLTQAERATVERLALESGRKMSAEVRALLQEALINRMAAYQKGVTR